MFITISELEETSALKNDDVFAISTMNGSTESTKKVKYSSIMGGVTSIVNQTEKKLNGLSFGTDSSGNWGYIKPGADSVTPFRNAAEIDEAYRRGKEDGAEQASTGDQYGLGYALGYDQGQASVKVAHKLTVPTTRNGNASITANWYTSIDNTACYDAGVASVKTAHKLTIPSARNANASVTGNWYTSVDNTACYDAGYNAGLAEGQIQSKSNVDKESNSYRQGIEDASTGVYLRFPYGGKKTIRLSKGTYIIAADYRKMGGNYKCVIELKNNMVQKTITSFDSGTGDNVIGAWNGTLTVPSETFIDVVVTLNNGGNEYCYFGLYRAATVGG